MGGLAVNDIQRISGCCLSKGFCKGFETDYIPVLFRQSKPSSTFQAYGFIIKFADLSHCSKFQFNDQTTVALSDH